MKNVAQQRQFRSVTCFSIHFSLALSLSLSLSRHGKQRNDENETEFCIDGFIFLHHQHGCDPADTAKGGGGGGAWGGWGVGGGVGVGGGGGRATECGKRDVGARSVCIFKLTFLCMYV